MRFPEPVSLHPYNRVEFTCKVCGTVARVDYEYGVGPVIGQEREYSHCEGDERRHLAGPIVAVWEEREGRWILAANRNTAAELATVS